MGGYLSNVHDIPHLSIYLGVFLNNQFGVCTEPLVTPEALSDISCMRVISDAEDTREIIRRYKNSDKRPQRGEPS
nr:hypothetical protein Iba_chr13cCG13820 [Ipomoea batatas]